MSTSKLSSFSATNAIALVVATCAVHVSATAQTCRSSVLPDTPTSRFSINADGTVSDLQTGLMWRRCAEGMSGDACQAGSPVAKTWIEALNTAQASTFAGYTDWRVPNVKELHSLVENRCMRPAVNTEVFPRFTASYFWTSTPHAAYSDRAWYVGFEYGSDNHAYTNGGMTKVTGAFVLLVR